MIISSNAAMQPPFPPVVVNLKVTVPAAVSAALGVYVAAINVALLNVPLPVVVHIPPPALVVAPERVTTALLAQTVWFASASAVGASVKVITMSSKSAGQIPVPVVVNLNVTKPVVVSVVLGV